MDSYGFLFSPNNASAPLNVVAVSTTTAIDRSMGVILANTTSGGFVLTLPSAVGIKDAVFTIKKTDATNNLATVATTSSQTIDGVLTYVLSFQYQDVTVISDGSNWQILNALAYLQNITAQTTGYAVLGRDSIIQASGGAISMTLPTAVGRFGKIYTIEKTDASLSNIITVTTTSSQTISPTGNTTTTFLLYTQGESLTVVSNGANWEILNHTIPSISTSFTPTGSWSTNTTYTGLWYRDGYNAVIQYKLVLAGTPTTTALTIDLPNSWTLATAKLVLGSTTSVATRVMLSGNGVIYDHSADNTLLAVPEYIGTATSFSLKYVASGGSLVGTGTINQAAPITWANLDNIEVTIRVPITGWNG